MNTTPTPLRPRYSNAPDLENEIEQAMRRSNPPASPPAMAPLDDLGRMSAEAVLTQYEAAAKAVEEMGVTVRDMVKRLGQSMIECDNDMRVVAETAAAIRDKGKHAEALIEQVSSLSKAIRETCADFTKKLS